MLDSPDKYAISRQSAELLSSGEAICIIVRQRIGAQVLQGRMNKQTFGFSNWYQDFANACFSHSPQIANGLCCLQLSQEDILIIHASVLDGGLLGLNGDNTTPSPSFACASCFSIPAFLGCQTLSKQTQSVVLRDTSNLSPFRVN